MAKMKHTVRARRLVATLAVLGALVLVAASCGGGGGGGPVMDPRDPVSPDPEIPIVPADDHGDTRADATDLALGSSVQGKIEEGDDDDYFRVQVTQAGTLTVYTTGSLDTQGELQASDGSILASDGRWRGRAQLQDRARCRPRYVLRRGQQLWHGYWKLCCAGKL